MDYCFVISLQYPLNGGFAISSQSGIVSVHADDTRLAVTRRVQKEVIASNRAIYGSSIPNLTFFSLEPNQLVTED